MCRDGRAAHDLILGSKPDFGAAAPSCRGCGQAADGIYFRGASKRLACTDLVLCTGCNATARECAMTQPMSNMTALERGVMLAALTEVPALTPLSAAHPWWAQHGRRPCRLDAEGPIARFDIEAEQRHVRSAGHRVCVQAEADYSMYSPVPLGANTPRALATAQMQQQLLALTQYGAQPFNNATNDVSARTLVFVTPRRPAGLKQNVGLHMDPHGNLNIAVALKPHARAAAARQQPQALARWVLVPPWRFDDALQYVLNGAAMKASWQFVRSNSVDDSIVQRALHLPALFNDVQVIDQHHAQIIYAPPAWGHFVWNVHENAKMGMEAYMRDDVLAMSWARTKIRELSAAFEEFPEDEPPCEALSVPRAILDAALYVDS